MLDAKKLAQDSESETSTVRKEKDSVTLLNERYNTPNTSLLLFHFEPSLYQSSEERLKECSIKQSTIEGKHLYIYDNFFLENESEAIRTYSRNASFSRSSYASDESREKGEEPARSMNNKEKWEFFAKPPQPVKEIYKLFGMIAQKINADISTLPWDICDQKICASAVATNRIERVSRESMDMGKHEDFNTEEGVPFGIPVLYSKDQAHFPGKFVNGAEGNPWLVSFMLYATEENFQGLDYGMGTIFCKKNGENVTTADCQNGRFVLFEGDILHGIEESKTPTGVHTWRISYVFKLIINPKQPNRSMKKAFHELMNSYKK